jgi:hypothetical protein
LICPVCWAADCGWDGAQAGPADAIRIQNKLVTATRKTCIALAAGILAEILACLISLPELAKTGSRMPTAPFVFPYALLAIHALPELKYVPGVLLLAQFPTYGAIFAWGWIENREQSVGRRLAAYHLFLGFGCALIYSV